MPYRAAEFMEIRVFNDFVSRPIGRGRVYEMKLDDGCARVTNFVFDRGFVINFFDMSTAYFTNQDRIGSMNYLMINATLMGRYVARQENSIRSRIQGMGIIHHPSSQREHIRIPTMRYIGLSIGLDLNGFRPIGLDDLPDVSVVLDDICARYRMDSMDPFILDDDMMMELYALKSLLDDPDSVDDDVAAVLVSDLVRRLYESDGPRFSEIRGSEDTRLEDELYSRIMFDLGVVPSINGICEEIGADKYGISRGFKKVYGDTPYSLQRHYRLITAGSRMLLGERSMEAVSESAGYGKENKFATAFRKEFGFRPKHFDKEFGNPLVTPNRSG
jgi:AraC-like DNA-binding protein